MFEGEIAEKPWRQSVSGRGLSLEGLAKYLRASHVSNTVPSGSIEFIEA